MRREHENMPYFSHSGMLVSLCQLLIYIHFESNFNQNALIRKLIMAEDLLYLGEKISLMNLLTFLRYWLWRHDHILLKFGNIQ